MHKQIKFLALALISCFPTIGFASVPKESHVGEARQLDWRWPFLLEKLVKNRMPKSYYDFLNARGVFTTDQILSLDDSIKRELLKMYREDLVIMAGNDHTRSIW